ncbi:MULTISPECIES: amino acid permease [unclassified Leptolyngbya]|uniref:amino acid permease n=1 Tax=unclassified Leptolyngbya TaxID=2650499 RepID=UPI001689330D|nr:MULTISPECIES: amino acid permease [unclassified Leptolyngbya]MBD1911777.1 amino acid permease [Leptolyngbya sp. FACHB-8]MBD2153333.1 amino acid permease [Leptolyngbya sp. FACHB-16]
MNDPDQKGGFVRYEDVGDDYLEKRKLRRSAGWILLWALGVGAVISGDFSGWNFGLGAGGFGGLAIGTLLMAVMYVCMVFSIAELTAALPHAGGFYSFTRNAFGPLGGFVCGVTDTIEYVITPAVVVFFIGAYMQTLIPGVPVPVWWVLYYALFAFINIRGVELTLKVGMVVTAIAAAILIIFGISVIFSGKFDGSLLFNIPPEGNNPAWLPFGGIGVFKALPYAMWFYLAIEQLPLAAEEAHNTVRDIPKALIWGIATLLGLSLLVLVLNPGLPVEVTAADGTTLTGAAAIGVSGAPIADGFRVIFGDGLIFRLLTIAALTGLVASFHTILYAAGRVMFSLSRAGYYPRWMSIVSKWHTPAIAVIVSSFIGLACAFMIQFGGATVGPALLNMAVFGAVISYTMVMLAYIRLKITRPQLNRPYLSPLGIPGAAVGAVLSLVALLACFSDAAYRPGVWGVAIFLATMIAYFVFYSRKKLVARAPEEEDALVGHAMREIEQTHSPHMHQ